MSEMDNTGWLTDRMNCAFAEHGDAKRVERDMLTGLCVLSCCVEPELYSAYHAEYFRWVEEHNEDYRQ